MPRSALEKITAALNGSKQNKMLSPWPIMPRNIIPGALQRSTQYPMIGREMTLVMPKAAITRPTMNGEPPR